MVSPNNIRVGSVINLGGNLFKVKNKEHVKLSKGGACQKLQCQDILKGDTTEIRLNVNDDIEEAFTYSKHLQFHYSDGSYAHFFDEEASSTVEIEISRIESPLDALLNSEDECTENLLVKASFVDNQSNEILIGCELVNDIEMKILDTSPSIKGETAASSHKPAKIAGNISVKVPPHVNIGDVAIFSKVDFSYIRKVSSAQ